jgi:hypothetical protein
MIEASYYPNLPRAAVSLLVIGEHHCHQPHRTHSALSRGPSKNMVHVSRCAASVESSIFPERVTGLRQQTDEDRAERALVVKRISGPKCADGVAPAGLDVRLWRKADIRETPTSVKCRH